MNSFIEGLLLFPVFISIYTNIKKIYGNNLKSSVKTGYENDKVMIENSSLKTRIPS